MAFTAAQTNSFFQNGPQMGLSADQRARLALEGLVTVEDFEDFKEDQLSNAIKNLRTGIPGVAAVVDAVGQVQVPAIAPIPPCVIPARSALRLKVASIAYHYYMNTGRTITSANMNYTGVLKGFYIEWEAIKEMISADAPKVPVLSKHQTPIKWMESFKDCLFNTFGVRKCPLSYVIRPNEAVEPENNVPLLAGFAYSESAGSVLQELIDRYTHIHPLFKSDNNKVYSLLEEATRGTVYAPTIKPFSRTKNGRLAWNAIISSHVGTDKWEKIQKEKTNFMINIKWNGRQYSLEKFTGLHRAAFTSLEEAALHINFQLPTEHTRVGYLLDNITSLDPDLRAALANVRANTNNMRDDFEATVSYILPVCPFAKHRSNNPRNGREAEISDATLLGRQHSKSGVDFRWHSKKEYAKLSKAQKQELYQWQQTKDGKKVLAATKGQGGDGGANKDGTNASKQSKKQLHARIATLEKELEGSKDDNNTPDNNMPSVATIQACLAAASAMEKDKEATKEVESKKRSVSFEGDQYKVAALAIQQIMKRSKP